MDKMTDKMDKMMDKMTGKIISSASIICLTVIMAIIFSGCGRHSTTLTAAEGAAITAVSGVNYRYFEDITQELMTEERRENFRAVTKVYKMDNLYAFIVNPIAYNGPITIALVINSDTDENIGIYIVDHIETPGYVRDMENPWFTGRFANKSARYFLRLSRVRAHSDRDIVAITGATVTTEGVINGVNAAFGVYKEHVLGQPAEPVPYMVRFEPGQGPQDTGRVILRAYGEILAEISLDEISQLPVAEQNITVHTTEGVNQNVYRGAFLSDVIALVDYRLIGDHNWILSVGVDSHISDIPMAYADSRVFIMYEVNGGPLPKTTGEPGALRLMVVSDVFGRRFTHNLLEVVLEISS